MIKMVLAPSKYKLDKFSVFLAGSIEMGKAENWQEKTYNWMAKNILGADVLVLNPRREDWDASWSQDDNRMKEQIDWELDGLENADLVVMYFDPKTTSPISLLELGLFKSKRLYVCCPKGYYRLANVKIVCKRYNIKYFDDLDKMMLDVKDYIDSKFKKEISMTKAIVNTIIGEGVDKDVDLMAWNKMVAQECTRDDLIYGVSNEKEES